MKKIAALICLAMAFLLIFTSCENQKEEYTEEENLPELVIGRDEYSPYSYTDESGNVVGVDADIAREACRRMGYKPVFVLIDWEDRDSFLENGEGDCVWSCFSMNNREDDYLWAGPYLDTRIIVAVKSDSGFNTKEDLNGAVFGVQAGSRSEDLLLKYDSSEVQARYVYCFRSLTEALTALHQGYVDAVGGQESGMMSNIENLPAEYRLMEDSARPSYVGVAFYKNGKKELAEALEKTLNEMAEDGTIQSVLDKYNITSDKVETGGNADDR